MAAADPGIALAIHRNQINEAGHRKVFEHVILNRLQPMKDIIWQVTVPQDDISVRAAKTEAALTR